jgi:ATP synthase protein I
MMSKALKIQMIVGVLAILAFYIIMNDAIGAGYGFLIAMLNILLLSFSFKKANNKSKESPQMGVMILYLSAVIRFVLLAVMFIIGLSVLHLQPMPVVITFVVIQVAQVFTLQGKQRLTD